MQTRRPSAKNTSWSLGAGRLTPALLLALCHLHAAERAHYGTGRWDADQLGNHRALVEVNSTADAVWAHIPWRRRDHHPESKNILVIDETTGRRVMNVARVRITREEGDIVFQPATVPGRYGIYYLPYRSSGRANYPTVVYPPPEATAEPAWLERHGLDSSEPLPPEALGLARARLIEMQSIDKPNSFWPMEVIATSDEMATLTARYPNASFLLFPEDRAYPIRMTEDLPLRWIDAGPLETFRGEALRGEFYAFQVGVYALRERMEDLRVEMDSLRRTEGDAAISAERFRCIQLSGVDWRGKAFTKKVSVEKGKVQPLWCGIDVGENTQPGRYVGRMSVSSAGLETRSFRLVLDVSSERIEAHGDNEPWRHSRLRWLDSTLALDDELVGDYTPVEVDGRSLRILGRKVVLGETGFPRSIVSFFAPQMTFIRGKGREMLSRPVELVVEADDGHRISWKAGPLRFVQKAPGRVVWEADHTGGPLTVHVHGEMELDGNMDYTVRLSSRTPVPVQDIRLLIPMKSDVAKYMMGMGQKGSLAPERLEWKWNVRNNQEGAWIGDVNAGLQFSLRDENYSRPLNTNFYHSKPLVTPQSWSNGGKGGCRLGPGPRASVFLVDCYSGSRVLPPGEPLCFNVRLLLTPFRPIDTDKQWSIRFYHRFAPLDEIARTGANTINVHHATPINPWINYPFLTPKEMKAYVDAAHARGMKVKIYYTVRELSNHAPELFALRSLGDEIFSRGPGGGFSWLQEHLGGDYIAGWFVPRLRDAAIVNSGVSRWHNYYLEGLNWLVRNIGIDGLYIDDVAFDRVVMKRLRKILDRGRQGALIDLHSANQYNERDGFANSANLYLEHFPYLDRLWFGEYFDYDAPPDFWLIEVSGIPFGLMGEMLQDGGNPWRGMLYGMTSRLPWAGDPSPLWRFWDAFGMKATRMVGYWVPSAPVKTHRSDVLSTTYVGKGKALIALASWAEASAAVKLDMDWSVLGIDPQRARLFAPAIENFQPARRFPVRGEIPVEPGRGWLLVLEEKTPGGS